jgi:hypothetical protein
MIIRTLLVFLCISTLTFAQEFKQFTGKLVYTIQMADTSLRELIPTSKMTVYTNDTLIRIENETDQIGKQVLIKHLTLNKSYLLLDTPLGKFAIQTDHANDTMPSRYSFQKKSFKRKIAGMRANRLLVSHADMNAPREFLYLKKYSPKYINNFNNFPGLPVHYYIVSIDGIYEYKLSSMENMLPEKDLFGIPSDYKRISYSDFVDLMTRVPENMEE